jgi:hypothetical protein
MIGYILTTEQYNDIQGQVYNGSQFFNCVPNIEGIYYLMLTEHDKEQIAENDWSYILDLPQGEFIPPLPTPFSYETN